MSNSRPSAIAVGVRILFADREDGGARRDRTDDLMLAKHALYQLSYGPLSASGEGTAQESVSFDPRRQQGDGRPGQTRTADLTLIRRTL